MVHLKATFSARAVVITAASLIALILIYFIANGIAGVVGSSRSNTDAAMAAAGFSVEYDADSRGAIYAPDDGTGFFLASKDGIRFIGADGTELMSDTYNLTTPVLIGEGGIAAVAEKNGSIIYVYDASGRLYAGQLDNPILSFAVNTGGYASLITQNGDYYKVVVYNSSGVKTYGELTDENIVPVATDISNDGRVLAISYLDYNGAVINSIVEFSYINKSESLEYQTDVFASNSKNAGQLIGIIRFMKDNLLITVSDQEIACISVENGADKLWTHELTNKLTAISFGGDSYFAAAYGEALPNMDSITANTVRFYDHDLKLLGEAALPQEISNLQCSQNAAIANSRSAFYGISKTGSTLWTYTSAYDNATAYFLGSTSRIALFSQTKTEILALSANTNLDLKP